MSDETNPVGRPTVFTLDVLQKLEECFVIGCPDVEACLIADISPASLYNYQKDHPEFLDRKNALKNMPSFKARKVINDAIASGDKERAQWYLERKNKDEFSPKSTMALTGANGDKIQIEVTGVEAGGKAPEVGDREPVEVKPL